MPSSARQLARENTALVVVDLQTKLLPAVVAPERVVENTRLLLRAAAVHELPRILTTQYSRGLGPTLPEVLELAPPEEPLDKTAFGCFGSDAFCELLRERAPRRTALLVAGIETHICVWQTVLGGLEKGYEVHVATDATSSRSPDDKAVALDRMQRAGAILSSTEMAIYELLGASDTPQFKALLPYLRERG